MFCGSRWNDSKRIIMVALAVDGLSAAKIAKRLPQTTRSSILNEACRLKISLKQFKKKVLVHDYSTGYCRLIPHDQEHQDFLASIFQTKGISLLDATETSCRWPCNDTKQARIPMCCGLEKSPDKPYCSNHMRLAYKTVNKQ